MYYKKTENIYTITISTKYFFNLFYFYFYFGTIFYKIVAFITIALLVLTN